MDWLAENWQFLIALAGLLMGSGGLLAYFRYTRLEAPRGEADIRGQEAQNYQKLLELLAEQGTQLAKVTTSLDEERQKRRNLEDRVEILEDERKALAKLARDLKMGIKKLLRQLQDLDVEPVWQPEE